MSKYIRSLNKDESYFKSSDLEVESSNILKDALNEAKNIREKALSATRDMLKAGKDVSYGVTGKSGVMGAAGVMGPLGTINTDVVRIKEIGSLDDYYVPIRVNSNNSDADIKIAYNPEDETYTIGDTKYTQEAINDFSDIGIPPHHSVSPQEVSMGSCGINRSLPQMHGACGVIKVDDSESPAHTQSGSTTISEGSVQFNPVNFAKTASCSEVIQHQEYLSSTQQKYEKENSYWADKRSADRLRKLAGLDGKIINGKRVVRAVPPPQGKRKVEPFIGNPKEISGILETMKKAYKKRNENWK